MLKIQIISIYKKSDHISSNLIAQPEILLTQPWNVSILCPHNARPADNLRLIHQTFTNSKVNMLYSNVVNHN